MPEYLTPAVYVEETSFRARSIEGVATSTVGMAGFALYGPISYGLRLDPLTVPGGQPPPADADKDTVRVVAPPPLVTSYGEYERLFGGLGDVNGDTNYAAYAARAFFGNGGRRLYVARAFAWSADADADAADPNNAHFATRPVTEGDATVAEWRTRWPGLAGRQVTVEVSLRRSTNIIVTGAQGGVRKGRLGAVREHALVELVDKEVTDSTSPVQAKVGVVSTVNGARVLRAADGSDMSLDPADGKDKIGQQLILDVTVSWGDDRVDAYTDLSPHPAHPRWIGRVLAAEDPADASGLVWLRLPEITTAQSDKAAVHLLTGLLQSAASGYLTGGGDGATPAAATLLGSPASPDDPRVGATGLNALTAIDDIAIVIEPDSVRFSAGDATAVSDLLAHCENQRYRIAIVDPPRDQSLSQIRRFRGQFDSKYGALYYPWVKITDPTQAPEPGAPPPTLSLPPSGFAAGIYARSDIERGVHKAPANEVIRGIVSFDTNVTFDRQAVLNPEGINALRFFTGRSNRVWGARTLTSDPEWKYVNVRRLFIYLEHSIDKATQWVVFEPNNERLWASVRQTIEDFLIVVWRDGALMGVKPEEAFFVRCDRTTMSQNDLDNGRLICLIGVSPTYPAEFVIFRIGQWTADAQRS